MQRRVNLYADELQRAGGTPVHIRVGLNSGEVVVRSIGSDLHMDYTAVGQTTHLAARMEQMAKESLILMEEALADPEATGTSHRPLLLAYLAEAHLLAGRRDDAVAVARRALDLSHRQKERGSEAWVLRLLGEIAAHADPPNVESAEGHYTQALARADELGMRPVRAHCHLGLGKLFHRTGDRPKTAEHLTIAATMYREMGMGFWLEKAEAELGSLLGTHSKLR